MEDSFTEDVICMYVWKSDNDKKQQQCTGVTRKTAKKHMEHKT